MAAGNGAIGSKILQVHKTLLVDDNRAVGWRVSGWVRADADKINEKLSNKKKKTIFSNIANRA